MSIQSEIQRVKILQVLATKIFFILMFIQCKAQEPLKVADYCMELYECKKKKKKNWSSWGYARKTMVNPSHEEIEIVMIGKISY